MSQRYARAFVAAILIAVLIAGLVFYFGLQGPDGVDRTAGLASTTAAIVGLATFLGVFFALERASERIDVNRRVLMVKPKRRKTNRSIHEQRIITQQNKIGTQIAQSVIRYIGITGDKLPQIKLNLLKAGFIGEQAIIGYTIAKIVTPIVGLLAGGYYGFVNNPDEMPMIAVFAVGGALAGSFLVEAGLKQRAKDRAQKIWQDFPDTIDLMIIYTETGATLDTALPRIVTEIKDNCPELGLELTILGTELRLQTERVRAYENLLRRVELPAVKSFVSIVKQSEQIGTPVTKALGMLSEELRRERMLIAERKAARIPVLITIPLMIFIMPAIFLVVLGPTVIRLLDILKTIDLPGIN